MCSLHDDAALPAANENGPKLLGVGCDSDNPRALILYFSFPLTDDQVRAIHDHLRRVGIPSPGPNHDRVR